MLSITEAVRELKLLRCKSRYTNNEIFEYHTCLNIIEEELCSGNSVVIDLTTFNPDNPDECYKAIQRTITENKYEKTNV